VKKRTRQPLFVVWRISMEYKILFSDFDGTLRSDGKDISEGNRLAIAAACEAGKKIVLCSGRSWKSLSFYEDELGLNRPGDYGIAFNGGVIYGYTEKGRGVLHRFVMDNDVAREAISFLKKYEKELGFHLLVFGADDDLYAEEDIKKAKSFSEDRRLSIKFVNDFSEFDTGFMKILVHGRNEALLKIAELIKPKFGDKCNIVFSAGELLELLSTGVDKGQGLMNVCDYLKIPISQAIAIGDEANDAPMLTKAGLGIAVANASDAAKAAADVVLELGCGDDAVKYAIEKYLM